MKQILFIQFLLFPFYGYTQKVFIADKGEIIFYSYAPVEDIEAKSVEVKSFLNTKSGEMAFTIRMRSFRFEKSLMEEHFNEKYIESEKYPQATFNGTLTEKIDFSTPGKYPVSAKGKLSIHGKEKEITESGEIEVTADSIMLSTQFYVALEDFNIKKPQILFNNIADTIQVKMHTTYIPFKKK